MMITISGSIQEFFQQIYEIYLIIMANLMENSIFLYIKNLVMVPINIVCKGLFIIYHFIRVHSLFFATLLFIFIICLFIYINLRCFLIYIRYFKLVKSFENINQNGLTYFTTDDINLNVLRNNFGIERECACLKHYVETYERFYEATEHYYAKKEDWLCCDANSIKEDLKSKNLILSKDLTYFAKLTKIEPSAVDLVRFVRTPYYQNDHFEYVGNGYFYQYYNNIFRNQRPHIGDMRASFYIWKPNKITVLGKKEANKIIPIKYNDFIVGGIGDGVVEPKNLIQFSIFARCILYLTYLFTVLSFIASCIILFFNIHLFILLFSYFLVTLIIHFKFIRYSNWLGLSFNIEKI